MSEAIQESRHEKGGASPATWDSSALLENWMEHLRRMVEENELSIPLKRVEVQAGQSPVYQEIAGRWDRMDGGERMDSWKRLLEDSEKCVKEVLPACVMCGDCCRRGSPTLHLDDLELLREDKIPWSALTTLRRGEPVRSPFEENLFFLVDERVKLKEKPGTSRCVFLDDDTDRCSIYSIRPLQCRAQACWDPEPAKDLAKQPYLTRRDLFKDVELLLELMTEHDNRCAFGKLKEAFERLEENQGETIDEVLELLAYEDHFRRFLGEKLAIPEDVLDLVFGRSFADLTPLFGFRVDTEEDGTRCLEADRG